MEREREREKEGGGIISICAVVLCATFTWKLKRISLSQLRRKFQRFKANINILKKIDKRNNCYNIISFLSSALTDIVILCELSLFSEVSVFTFNLAEEEAGQSFNALVTLLEICEIAARYLNK